MHFQGTESEKLFICVEASKWRQSRKELWENRWALCGPRGTGGKCEDRRDGSNQLMSLELPCSRVAACGSQADNLQGVEWGDVRKIA